MAFIDGAWQLERKSVEERAATSACPLDPLLKSLLAGQVGTQDVRIACCSAIALGAPGPDETGLCYPRKVCMARWRTSNFEDYRAISINVRYCRQMLNEPLLIHQTRAGVTRSCASAGDPAGIRAGRRYLHPRVGNCRTRYFCARRPDLELRNQDHSFLFTKGTRGFAHVADVRIQVAVERQQAVICPAQHSLHINILATAACTWDEDWR